MTENVKPLTDLEQARRGLGIEEEPQSTSPENADPAPKEEKPAESDPKSPTEAPAESEEEEEEAEEEDEEEDEDVEDTVDPKRPAKTVPLARLKEEKRRVKELEKELADAKKAPKTPEEPPQKGLDEEIKDAAKALAEELNIEEEGIPGIEKILATAAKLAAKGQVLPDDLKDKLALLDEFKKEKDAAKQKDAEKTETQFFEDEWKSLSSTIEQRFPNATQSQKEDAKKLMDKLSHSKKYGNVPGEHPAYSLDYVLYKESKQFQTIFETAEKKKSAEPATRGLPGDGERARPSLNLGDMTPAKLAEIERAREAEMEAEEHKMTVLRDSDDGDRDEVSLDLE